MDLFSKGRIMMNGGAGRGGGRRDWAKNAVHLPKKKNGRASAWKAQKVSEPISSSSTPLPPPPRVRRHLGFPFSSSESMAGVTAAAHLALLCKSDQQVCLTIVKLGKKGQGMSKALGQTKILLFKHSGLQSDLCDAKTRAIAFF